MGMTEQEAIEQFEERLSIPDYRGAIPEYYDAMELAVKALEKQIAKNWIAEYIGDGEFIWTCPSCKETFALMDGTPQDNLYNYCPSCGQALAEQRENKDAE